MLKLYVLVLFSLLPSISMAQPIFDPACVDNLMSPPVSLEPQTKMPCAPPSLWAQEAMIEPVKDSLFVLGATWGALDGGVYVGGKKIPASFYLLDVSFKTAKPSFYFGGEFQHLYNESKVKTTSLFAIGGKRWVESWFFWGFEGGLGYSQYEESTAIQQAQANGLGILMRAQVGHEFYKSWSVVGSYNWIHYTFSDSFWGKDMFDDVAIDQMGLSLSLEFKF